MAKEIQRQDPTQTNVRSKIKERFRLISIYLQFDKVEQIQEKIGDLEKQVCNGILNEKTERNESFDKERFERAEEISTMNKYFERQVKQLEDQHQHSLSIIEQNFKKKLRKQGSENKLRIK